MPRTSQTELAILGALSIEPMSGYRLRAEILATLGHFWTESFGQIYPSLAKLEEAGFVEREAGEPFSITPSGRRRLRELLRTPPEPIPPRNALLLRLFFGKELGPAGCRELLDRTERDVRAKLDELATIRARLDPEDPDERYQLVTLSAGEHHGRATLDWIAETRGLLGL